MLDNEFLKELTASAVDAACGSNSEAMAVNPAVGFTRMAKLGAYDSMPDADYKRLLDDLEWASKQLFHDRPLAPVPDVFSRLVGFARLPEQARASLAAEIRKGVVRQDPEGISYAPLPDPQINLFQIEAPASGAALPERFQTPRQIYNYLNLHVYGQTEAKKAASMILWNHVNNHPRNAIFAGPTGCGKTEIWRSLSQIYPNITIVDASMLTQEGWKGSSKISQLPLRFPNMKTAGHAIYVFDEADKMFEPATTSAGEDTSQRIQSELLTLVEGGILQIDEKQSMSTVHCSFVFLGSFERMVDEKAKDKEKSGIGFGAEIAAENTVPAYAQVFTQDDLIQYANVRREVAGRIGTIVQLSPMKAEDYLKILHSRFMSPVSELERKYKKKIILPNGAAEKLCIEAEESKMGVRFIRSRITEELDRQMFEDTEKEEYVLFEDTGKDGRPAASEGNIQPTAEKE